MAKAAAVTTTESEHELIKQIKAATEATIQQERKQEFPFRHHLGASVIGHPCERYLFYSFRWVKETEFRGRVLRIFDRGHAEEDKMLNHLKSIGLSVATNLTELMNLCGLPIERSSVDTLRLMGLDIIKPDILSNTEQIKINAVGHIGGSIDAILVVPANYVPEFGNFMVIECKTHNANNFALTFRKDLGESQPKHYSQANLYSKYINATHMMYMGENKNDDELNYKIIKTNHVIANLSENRAKKVIFTQNINELPKVDHLQAWRCKMCDFQKECAKKIKATSRNCRSCKRAVPNQDGTWFCGYTVSHIEKYKEIEIAEDCEGYENIL